MRFPVHKQNRKRLRQKKDVQKCDLFRDTVTSVRTGCDSVVAYQVLVKKAVYPQLSVSIDRDTLREGENAALTIMSDKAYDVDREIKLVSSYQWGTRIV